MARINPLKNFSAGKIGSGRLFNPGSFSSKNRRGLAGALRKFKSAGRYSYAKNLSKQNLETFHGLIGEERSKVSVHSEGIGHKARRRIMQKAETLHKQGKISSADKADLKNIVEAINSVGAHSPNEPKDRAVSFGGSQRITSDNPAADSYISPEAQKHIEAGIYIDNLREMDAEDRGEGQLNYDPKNQLGRHQAIQNKRDSAGKNTKGGRKVDLPDITNLPDMDIG